MESLQDKLAKFYGSQPGLDPAELMIHSDLQDCMDGDHLDPEIMKAVMDSTPAGIGIVKNRVILWTSQALCAMLGYDCDFLIGADTRVLYSDPQEYSRVGRDLYPQVKQCGTGLVETKLLKKDGDILNCRIRASQLDPDDFSRGLIFVITDVSELKMLQTQLQQAQKMEAIGVLAGGVSHDFNNILMGIQGHLSLMMVDVTAVEKVESHVKQIQTLVRTASDLTKRLLGFARGGKYQVSVVNLNDLIPLSLNIFAPTRKDIVVHEDYDDSLDMVDADQTQMEQVFVNLLINASQAMPDHGEIFIETKNFTIGRNHKYPFEITPGSYVKATVTDTGTGMDNNIMKRIFDPFFSTKEIGDQKGRGLGLSTVYGIVKNHGGFILVDSKKGKGSSFHVCLPASAQSRTKEIIEDVNGIQPAQTGTETILLVDDEPEIVNIGKNFLEKLGYKALIARNGLEAIELLKVFKNEISLIVLDLIMPEMNGQQAYGEIKKMVPDARVLISTGYAVDDRIEDLMSKGCQGFIRKPFSMNEFSYAIRKILDQ